MCVSTQSDIAHGSSLCLRENLGGGSSTKIDPFSILLLCEGGRLEWTLPLFEKKMAERSLPRGGQSFLVPTWIWGLPAYPSFTGLIINFFPFFLRQFSMLLTGGKFLLFICRRAPGLNSLGTENAPTAKPQPYPDPQSHYTGWMKSPSHGERKQIIKDARNWIIFGALSIAYCVIFILISQFWRNYQAWPSHAWGVRMEI